jgi:hypothetical protein
MSNRSAFASMGSLYADVPECDGIMNTDIKAIREDVQDGYTTLGQSVYSFITDINGSRADNIGVRASKLRSALIAANTYAKAIRLGMDAFTDGWKTEIVPELESVDDEAYQVFKTARSNFSGNNEDYAGLTPSDTLSVMKGTSTLEDAKYNSTQFNYAQDYLDKHGITGVSAQSLVDIAKNYKNADGTTGVTVEWLLTNPYSNLVTATTKAGLSLSDYVKANSATKNYTDKVSGSDALAGYSDNTSTLSGTSDLMSEFSQFADGTENDFTKYKTFEDKKYLTYGDQATLQTMAQTDESGLRYISVDGLVNSDGTSKVYMAAFGTVIAQATSTTGTGVCGGIMKVTWEDGSYDYMIVGDVKGTTPYGQKAGYYYSNDGEELTASEVTSYSYTDSNGNPRTGYKSVYTGSVAYKTTCSNAIELIVDNLSVYDSSMYNEGVLGAGSASNVTAANDHWSQAFTNIEAVGMNLIY